MNQWNLNMIFGNISLTTEKNTEYTITIIDYDKIEQNLANSNFEDAKKIIERVK